MNLCSTSLVLPCSVPKSAPLPSITIKPNLLSSDSRAVNACVGTLVREEKNHKNVEDRKKNKKTKARFTYHEKNILHVHQNTKEILSPQCGTYCRRGTGRC